ncbi:MAG TPA: prolyl oligopeptidase family serine peptidase [Chitinophagaceae bacterium]|nr:prolyl oligopeptidase family serine peptidase [Chitinophagaceae bacterium]
MRNLVLPLAALALLASCGDSKKPEATLSSLKPIEVKYPVTRKDSAVKDSYFGTEVYDPYRWLENDTSKETKAWVIAENVVTANYLEQVPFRSAIRKRYEELFNYEKYSAPFKEGEYTYYYKNSGLQNQSVLYREKQGGAAEVFLDPNTFSSKGTTSLAGINFTKDGSLAAYIISEGGSDWQKLIVMDAATKKIMGDTLDLKFSGAAWKGNEGFYYSTYDKVKDGSRLSGITEHHKLYYHKIGTAQKDDELIFGGSAPLRRYVWGGVTEDQKWLIIGTGNETYGNDLYLQDLTMPDAPIIPIVSDLTNSHGVVYSDDQYLYIQTDRNAPTGKLVKVPLTSPQEANWTTIIESKPEVLTTSAAGGSLFCSYLVDAITKVYQFDTSGKQVREIKLPGLGSASGFGGKKDEKEVYYGFTSYVNPYTIYKLNIADGKTEMYKQPTLKADLTEYESKQVFYKSKDGAKIPMIITWKKGTKLDGKNPCLLYGYGGFSVSITPFFSTSKMILLENGGIFAVANIRGGGEYGEDWHQQGIKTKKQNVFDDFIAASDFLVDSMYTSRDLLAIQGGSNGGLLVGACITQKPDMCKVAFPQVGVLDMLRYHKFTAGAGWAYDYGTSEDSKEMFDYLYKYSPVHNVKEVAYPAIMITTADHDDRVVPAHSFKFAATLQEKHKGTNPILIRIDTDAGHGAGKSTQQIIDEETDTWSFMFYNIGLNPKY